MSAKPDSKDAAIEAAAYRAFVAGFESSAEGYNGEYRNDEREPLSEELRLAFSLWWRGEKS